MIGDIILEDIESEMITQDAPDDIPLGYIPFFEIGDSGDFLFIRSCSKNSNAVWDGCGIKIEDSLQRFIWRLYYESPKYFYDTVLKKIRVTPTIIYSLNYRLNEWWSIHPFEIHTL